MRREHGVEREEVKGEGEEGRRGRRGTRSRSPSAKDIVIHRLCHSRHGIHRREGGERRRRRQARPQCSDSIGEEEEEVALLFRRGNRIQPLSSIIHQFREKGLDTVSVFTREGFGVLHDVA